MKILFYYTKENLAAQGKIEDLKAIDKEVEIHVWGSPGKMEETLKDRGMKVRREGRAMSRTQR